MRWIKNLVTIIVAFVLLAIMGNTIPVKIIKEFIHTTDTVTVEKIIYKSVYELQPTLKYKMPYDSKIIERMDSLANLIYMPLIDRFGEDNITINSFYRSWNWYSDHTGRKGMAFDISHENPDSNWTVYSFIKDSLPYDQEIVYPPMSRPSRIHVGLRNGNNRKQNKKAYKSRGIWKYRLIK